MTRSPSNQAPQATTNGGAQATDSPDVAVRITGLSKSFDGRLVLNDVALNVPRSKIVSIIGSSGGGKTTLLRCVNLLERPDRAQLEIAGEPVFAGERIVCRRPRTATPDGRKWSSNASTPSRTSPRWRTSCWRR
jgi:ABC-type glutathione transport system ATPase component